MIRLSSWWRYLTSPKLALLLLIILTAITAIGSLFPSINPDIAANQELYNHWLEIAEDKYGLRAGIYHALGLFNMYQSTWYWAILGITALLTLGCVISRWRVIRALVRLKTWSRAGSLFTHLGAVILIAGTGWSTWGGWQTDGIILPPGQPVKIPQEERWPYALRYEDFEIQYDSDGQVQNYQVKVSVLSGDHVLLTDDLQVNDPLFFDKIGFYLKSYGYALIFSGTDANGKPLTMQPAGEEKSIDEQVILVFDSGETKEVSIPGLKATLKLAPSSRAETSQQEGYFVEVTNQSGQTIAAGIAFPGKDFKIAGGTFKLERENYVELKAAYQPGFWPAIAGSSLILLGTILMLFVSPFRRNVKQDSGQP